jgi:hypothetical protein
MYIMKKLYAGIFGIVGMYALLTGCGNNKNPADFNIDEPSDEAVASAGDLETTEENQNDVIVWEDEFDVETSSSINKIKISATIEDSDTEPVSVVTMQEPEFNEEYKKAVIEAVFGAGDIYIYGETRLTKSEIEERISDTNEQIETIRKSVQDGEEYYWSETKQDIVRVEEADEEIADLEATLEEYEAVLASAPEEYVKADDYSSDEYLREYGGINYTLEFGESSEGMYRKKYITFKPLDFQDVCSDELDDCNYELHPSSAYQDSDLENICTTSREDAILTAKQFAAQIGFSDLKLFDTYDCVWVGAIGDSWDDDLKFVKDGYVVRFEHNIEGKWLDDNVMYYSEALGEGYDVLGHVENPQYQLDCYLEIYVNDYGIVNMEYINPLTELKKTEDVPMISLDSVQEIMTAALKNDTDKYVFAEHGAIQKFCDMDLVYFRLHSGEEDGLYSYVPAWVLCEQRRDDDIVDGAVIVVNAIDGSIIDVKKELFGE